MFTQPGRLVRLRPEGCHVCGSAAVRWGANQMTGCVPKKNRGGLGAKGGRTSGERNKRAQERWASWVKSREKSKVRWAEGRGMLS